MNKLEELDHPCRDTCSGWKQGYERGSKDASTAHNDRVKILIDEVRLLQKEVSDLEYTLMVYREG